MNQTPSILGPDGRPVNAERVKIDRLSRFNPLADWTPEVLTRQLLEFSRGRLSGLAWVMEWLEKHDDTISTVAPKAKAAVSRHGHDIVFADGLRKDQKHAAEDQREYAEGFYANLETGDALELEESGGMRLLVQQVMDAYGKTLAAHHIIWKPTKDGLRAKLVKVPLWFFEASTGRLRFLPTQFSYDGVDLATLGGRSAWMVSKGRGVMLAGAIARMFKQIPLQDWLTYCDRHGMPAFLGKTNAKKGDAGWNEMRDAVASLGSEFGGVINTSDEIAVLSLAAQGELPYEKLVDRMDRAQVMLWRGGDLSTISRGGGAVGSNPQIDETDELDADNAAWVEETLNANLTRQVIGYRFGKDAPVLVKLKLRTKTRINVTEEIATVKAARELGVRISASWFVNRFGITEADEDEVALGENSKSETLNSKEEKKETDAINAYNPLQERAPKGSEGGGRWTAGGAATKGSSATRGEMRAATAEERKKYGIAPAFTDPQITDDPDADLRATAKNAKGKTVYYYSEEYSKSQAAAKFARISALHQAMPGLQAKIDESILAGGDDRDAALTMRMVTLTGLRNGGEGGGGKVESFGASSLLTSHARVVGDQVHLDFPGKKGVKQIHSFEDSTLARHIKARQDAGAERIFDGDDKKTLGYLKKISNNKFKVHDFRTWHGTMLADATAAKIAGRGELPKNDKEFKAFQIRVSKVVGRQLGNDAAMSLRAYIHPTVFEPYKPKEGGKKAA